ncbi:tyrosine-type recombinase/integrase [Burkholderia multivorans]|uniref:tyrosine-type recombinase/integrase n=2 Tax=Burkholderia multivorans TaxID=87883 RepID=UPI0035104802
MAFTQDHWSALKRHGTERVWIAYDRDEAGNAAADKLGTELRETGIETWRVLFPKGMDANGYAGKVAPAEKSLGVLLQQAEWIGKGKPHARPAPAVAEPLPPEEVRDVQPASSLAVLAEPSGAPTLAAAAETNEEASVPASTPMQHDALDMQETVAGELQFTFGERVWRIRGWQKNLGPEQMRVPKHVLSADEAERILNVPDVTSALGIRDRAILETFYSTGIRRAELTSLHVHDVDHDRGTVMVREGKGKRDRLIPIGARALAWIRKYLDEVRPQLSLAADEGVLFLAVTGDSIGTRSLGLMVSDYIKRSGVNKSGSCHLFRHTMATLMLENGADVRFVQVMLGHAQLTSTQIYTQVAIRALKEIHTATHPARLERQAQRDEIEAAKPERLLHRVYGKREGE